MKSGDFIFILKSQSQVIQAQLYRTNRNYFKWSFEQLAVVKNGKAICVCVIAVYQNPMSMSLVSCQANRQTCSQFLSIMLTKLDDEVSFSFINLLIY